MKFSFALFLSTCRIAYNARPSLNSSSKNLVSVEKEDVETEGGICRDDEVTHCTEFGQTPEWIRPKLLRRCERPCCGNGGKHDGKCMCLHTNHNWRNGYEWHGPRVCCAKKVIDGATHPFTKWDLPNNLCPCSEVGSVMNEFGSKEEDCCSKIWDAHQKCLPKPCTGEGKVPGGEKGGCCRDARDIILAKVDGKCGCFHTGQKPHHLYDTGAHDCCSKTVDGLGYCKCIQNGTKLPDGADAHDCCSKGTTSHDGGVYCKATNCSEVGVRVRKGDHCCTESQSPDGTCMCLPPMALSPGGDPRHCCSGRVDSSGKCDYLYRGETPDPESSSCFTGETHNGKCSCVGKGRISTNKKHCCAGELSGDKCGCLKDGALLVQGASASDCCSHIARGGSCGNSSA